jgi:hypothetical protein
MGDVGIVFLGFGRMGRAAHTSFLQASDQLRKNGIEPRLLAVLETDTEVIRTLPNYTEAKAILVEDASSQRNAISALLRTELGLRTEDEFLVYDATPSPCHQRNLVDVCETFPRALYLGEKPLFTSRSQLSVLDRFADRVLCDFVESQNEAVLKLLEMQRAGFRIERLRFWRMNSTGLRRLLEPEERGGVTGGALLDKGIHDLAVTSILLRNQGLLPITPIVSEARNLTLMPDVAHSVKANGNGNGRADAAGYAHIEWLSSEPVNTEFSYSWIGVEAFDDLCARSGQPSLRALLAEHGLYEDAWLSRAPLEQEAFDQLEQQEARVLVVDGTEDGRKVRLIVNFLIRPGIHPFVFHTERREYLNLASHCSSKSSVARIFDLAIGSYVNKRPLICSPLGSAVIRQVHRTSFDIRDLAFTQQPLCPTDTWTESFRMVR